MAWDIGSSLRCRQCGLSAGAPGGALDAAGVCELCRRSQPRTAGPGDPAAAAAALARLARRHPPCGPPGQRARHDIIVLYSGGKDSTYALARLARDVGLRPLAVSLDNWFLSRQAQVNQTQVISRLDVDHLIVRPARNRAVEMYRRSVRHLDREEWRKYFVEFGALCWPCFSLIYAAVCRLAAATGIRLIVGGWSPGQVSAGGHTARDDGLIDFREVIGIYVEPLRRLLAAAGTPDAESLPRPEEAAGVLLLPFFSFWPYSDEEVTDYIVSQLGWARPTDTDSCSSNCLLNRLDRLLYRQRFGFDRYEMQLANMVRRGLLRRQDLLAQAAEPLDPGPAREAILALGIEDLFTATGGDHCGA